MGPPLRLFKTFEDEEGGFKIVLQGRPFFTGDSVFLSKASPVARQLVVLLRLD
jgi:hypothetical protein